jgi:adenine-specific DNA-methyltransferase
MSKHQRLELTWVGKDIQPRLEPRILMENPKKSYHAATQREGDFFDNKLIFGDNLLALRALEQEFAGKVKCIYIDPPYNTGSAFAQYDDGVEHSVWLSLMRDRIEILRRLLTEDGSLWVQLDDNEVHYCRVLMDEIFGRQNFVANVIWNKSYAVRSNAQFFSTAHEHVLVYCKERQRFNPNKFGRTAKQEARYDNPDNDPRGIWQSVTMTISLVGGARGRQFAKTGQSENIFEVSSPSGKKFLPPPNRCWSRNPKGFAALDAERRIWWGANGDRAPRLKQFLLEAEDGILPTTLWANGEEYGLNQQGIREIRSLGIPDFPTPKPEQLISKVLELGSNPGDLVLDSFAGSGTTGAVAHKMRRRWIMVELGDHCDTHIIPRMKKVVDGTDSGGISEAVGWKGGGGFRYYHLAPSLLTKDKWENWIISPQFNPEMLSEAVCKLMGFVYRPSQNPAHYWQQGHSSEQDFIFVTTASLTHDALKKLSEEVGPNRTLLVCCKAFNAKEDGFENLTIRKIPQTVLTKCEWGRDDYSLKVANLPQAEPEPDPLPIKSKPAASTGDLLDLLDDANGASS